MTAAAAQPGLMVIDRGPHRYRLGAEELLELGRAQTLPPGAAGRRPFFMGRPRPERRPWIGQAAAAAPESVYILDVLGSVAGLIADGLSFALNTLGSLVDIPLGILSQGVDITFNGLASLFSGVPFIGDVLAQILLLGGSLIKFGLSIPGLALHGLGNVFGGIAKFMKGENSEGENQKKVDGAKKDIVGKAPASLKDNVKAILDSSGVTGKDLTPAVRPDGTVTTTPVTSTTTMADVTVPAGEGDLSTALAVGIPAVGALALIAALA